MHRVHGSNDSENESPLLERLQETYCKLTPSRARCQTHRSSARWSKWGNWSEPTELPGPRPPPGASGADPERQDGPQPAPCQAPRPVARRRRRRRIARPRHVRRRCALGALRIFAVNLLFRPNALIRRAARGCARDPRYARPELLRSEILLPWRFPFARKSTPALLTTLKQVNEERDIRTADATTACARRRPAARMASR